MTFPSTNNIWVITFMSGIILCTISLTQINNYNKLMFSQNINLELHSNELKKQRNYLERHINKQDSNIKITKEIIKKRIQLIKLLEKTTSTKSNSKCDSIAHTEKELKILEKLFY